MFASSILLEFLVQYLELILLIILLGSILIDLIRKRTLPWDNRHVDGPVLMSQGLLGSGNILPLHQGKMHGHDFNFLALMPGGKPLMVVQVGHDTGLHLLGIGAHSSIDSKMLKPVLAHSMQKVDLEGNFPTDFTLFCQKGQGLELTQLFDPADMAYFADFCRSYDFELYKDVMYFGQTTDQPDKKDTTTLTKDVGHFLEKNWLFIKMHKR